MSLVSLVCDYTDPPNCYEANWVDEFKTRVCNAITENAVYCSPCGTLPTNFDDYITLHCAPFVPDCAIMIVQCEEYSVAYAKDSLGNWVALQIQNEFRVGDTGYFADPANPTDLELNNLFVNGTPPNDALVWNVDDISFWTWGGIAWTEIDSIAAIAIVNSQLDLAGPYDLIINTEGAFQTVFTGTVYDNTLHTVQIQTGDLVHIDAHVQYRITTQGTGVDDVKFRFIMSGALVRTQDIQWLEGGANVMFSYGFEAIADASLTFTFRVQCDSTPATGWVWEARLNYVTVTVIKAT